LKNGKGLDTKIIKVLPLNQPFSPSSLPSRKKTFSSEFFYGPSFFHEETKKTRKFACDEKTNIISICPALSSQV